MVNPPNMVIPAKVAGNATEIVFFFSLCFVVFEYQHSPDGSFAVWTLCSKSDLAEFLVDDS